MPCQSELRKDLKLGACLKCEGGPEHFLAFSDNLSMAKSGQGCVCLLVSQFATRAVQPHRRQNRSAAGLTGFPLFFLCFPGK